jgi:hypothetical protein
VIPEGGHDTSWLPQEMPFIEEFKQKNSRDPLPESVKWVADRTDKFNRNLWIQIDELSQSPGLIEVTREGNDFNVITRGVSAFTLLLNPSEVNFSLPVGVTVNGEKIHQKRVMQNANTLLRWASIDKDRSMLFTAELKLRVND